MYTKFKHIFITKLILLNLIISWISFCSSISSAMFLHALKPSSYISSSHLFHHLPTCPRAISSAIFLHVLKQSSYMSSNHFFHHLLTCLQAITSTIFLHSLEPSLPPSSYMPLSHLFHHFASVLRPPGLPK